MELLGEPLMMLHAASSAAVAYFHVRLCDVAQDGTSRLICDGGLLATHRNSHERPEPLVSDQVYGLRIPLRHCAYRVATGHRLRLALASAEFQNAWPTGQPAVNTVHYGGGHASHIVLPVAPADPNPLPTPDLARSPHAMPPAEALARPEYRIELDLIGDTVSCVLRPADTGRTSSHSRLTVSNRDPARTVISASATHIAEHPTLDIRVEATCQTSSDATSYSHTSQVRITIGGAEHFRKSWAGSVPRNLS
jgi:hypothetical protein